MTFFLLKWCNKKKSNKFVYQGLKTIINKSKVVQGNFFLLQAAMRSCIYSLNEKTSPPNFSEGLLFYL